MVGLAEIQSAYYLVAATGVLLAAAFYIMNLRMVQKKMKIDAAILYGNLVTEKERIRDWRHILFETNYASFEEWEKGSRSNPEDFLTFQEMAGGMNQLGLLLKEKVVDPEMLMTLLGPIWPKVIWLKLAPIIEGQRKIYNYPQWRHYAEFLYKEAERMYPEVKVSIGRFQPKEAGKSP